mgnify:CR=1 FL=1
MKETMPKDVIKKIYDTTYPLNSDVIKYHQTGIVNKQFGTLTGTTFTCEKGHERKILDSVPILRLESDDVTSFKLRLHDYFKLQKSEIYCRECKVAGG